MNDVHVEP